ncbi:hypothetical protein V6347_17340 [Acinetobacter baumannii]|nr:hypothetical protein [Acinetobacter baumannii]
MQSITYECRELALSYTALFSRLNEMPLTTYNVAQHTMKVFLGLF